MSRQTSGVTPKIEQLSLKKPGESLYIKFYGIEEFQKQVIFFHDVGEYHDRYLDFASFLNKHQIGCTFIDMRGHGLSSGTRGHVDDYHQFKSDYELFWTKYSHYYDGKSMVCLGHGVGALVAMMFMLSVKSVKGCCLINPTVNFKRNKTFHIEEFIGKKSLLDKLRISANFMGEDLTTEKSLANSYDHDPLVNKKVTLGMYKCLLELFAQVKKASYFINRPLFIALGLEDQVVDMEKSLLFASSFEEQLLTLKEYEDLGHEFFNEIDRDKGFKDIYNWINKILNNG
jgi:alpha-beta hydrolase superfamily lysophospholipase